MELEEMKSRWAEMSGDIEKQKKLTDSLIIKMIRTDYRYRINKILLPEATGAFVCFAGILFILINFQKLNTWYLLVCGIISVIILLLMPYLSIKGIRMIRSLNIPENNFKQTLLEYSKGKVQFVFAQKLSFYLGSILMLVILPVMGKLIGGKDFFIETRLWMWYALGFPFFYYFTSRVYKSYIKSTIDAEKILNELKN